MRIGYLSILLALCLLISSIPVASAVFDDTQGHWAEEYIQRAVSDNLFEGISETEFDPDSTMSRAMFVTVLGRFEGIDLEFWSSESAPRFFSDVPTDSYYAPYVSWAVCNQIVSGMSETEFAPDAPVTREQMAKLIAYYVEKMGYRILPVEGDFPESFSDADEISDWASDSVEILRESGIFSGELNEDGTYSFLPHDTATRAEAAAVFCRIAEVIEIINSDTVLPTQITLNASEVELDIGDTYQLVAEILPQSCALLWRSSDSRIISVDENGLVTARAHGTAVISVHTPNGLYAACTFTCNADFASANDTYAEKCMRVFGEVVSDPRNYYAIYDENGNRIGWDYDRAKADMVSITVDTWDIDKNGEKYTRQFTIHVHKNLADTYIQIFKEIYEGEEKFPIHYLWGYTASGYSEHMLGTAVDINPNENYYYNPRTGQQVGDYWKPGEDPYSIPLDGEVATIFAKYGFRQGAYWNSGTKDYMHFSFFGT